MPLDQFFEQFKDVQFVEPVPVPNVLVIKWARKGVGFGELTLVVKEDGLHLDTETMGAPFVKQVLGALVDDAFAAGRAE